MKSVVAPQVIPGRADSRRRSLPCAYQEAVWVCIYSAAVVCYGPRHDKSAYISVGLILFGADYHFRRVNYRAEASGEQPGHR